MITLTHERPTARNDISRLLSLSLTDFIFLSLEASCHAVKKLVLDMMMRNLKKSSMIKPHVSIWVGHSIQIFGQTHDLTFSDEINI